MPNLFAYVVLFSSPLIAIILFRRLPLRLALIWVIFGGYMVLPDRAGFDLPLIPKVDKELIPALMAAILCVVTLGEAARRLRRARPGGPSRVTDRAVSAEGFVSARAQPIENPVALLLGPEDVSPPRSAWITALVAVCLVGPILTTMTNRETLVFGPTVIPGLSLSDTWSAVQAVIVMLIPFVLARRFLASAASHEMILRVLCHMALGMSVAIMIEVRLSPQLNQWIYGFQGGSFAQHIRAGGYRPMLFLQHGLWVGIIIAMSVIAALTLYRSSTGAARLRWLAVAAWLFVTLIVSKTLGALGICIVIGGAMLFMPRRGQLIVVGVFACAVVGYPMLRSSGLVPVTEVYDAAMSYSADRAQSFMFRLVNEDQLLARANEKPLTGWGGWDRPAVFDTATGAKVSIADGEWVIAIGAGGWIGYIGLFGLLCMPLVMLTVRPRRQMTTVTAGLLAVLVVNIIDLIPNATLTPITWLLAGAVAGFYDRTAAQPRQARHIEATTAA